MPTVKNTVTRRHAVAAGLTAMTALAAGCSSNQEIPPPKAVDAFDWKNFSGETLSLLMSEHPVSIAVREHLSEFGSGESGALHRGAGPSPARLRGRRPSWTGSPSRARPPGRTARAPSPRP